MPAGRGQLYEEARKQALDSKWTSKGLEHIPGLEWGGQEGSGGQEEGSGGSGPENGVVFCR